MTAPPRSEEELRKLCSDSINDQCLQKFDEWAIEQEQLIAEANSPKIGEPLWKKGKVNKSWKQRFFLFEPDTAELSYYSSEQDCQAALDSIASNVNPEKRLFGDTLTRWKVEQPQNRKSLQLPGCASCSLNLISQV